MTIPLAYNTALLAVSIYVALWGGRIGRWGVGMFLLATLLTYVGAKQASPYASINWWMLIGDLGLLIGFLILSIKGRRYWPIWASALQFNGVLSHAVAWLAPVVIAKVYYAMTTLWGVPILVIMVIGTMQDRKSAQWARLGAARPTDLMGAGHELLRSGMSSARG